ncbi:TIGR04222 domain-containing membrane protein [Actinomycetes bacterium M1A6_2h]
MGNDTWGIPSHIFLIGYIAAAVGVLVYAVYVLSTTGPSNQLPTRPPRTLTPPEVGMLVGEGRAVAAALGILRAGDYIGPRPRYDSRSFDPFTTEVLQATRSGGYPGLVKRVRGPLDQMRSELEEMGLMVDGADRRAKSASLPLTVLFFIGTARFVFGMFDGKPVIYLFIVMAILALAGIPLRRFARSRRLTARGKSELARITSEYDYLSPKQRPAYSTYGAPMVGLSAALFGVGALQLLDPDLAKAADFSGGSDSGFSFGGDGDGGGGDGGGGGGGCGGGGCGG